jgi:hypothetical protein
MEKVNISFILTRRDVFSAEEAQKYIAVIFSCN